jgi:hypothetical protein
LTICPPGDISLQKGSCKSFGAKFPRSVPPKNKEGRERKGGIKGGQKKERRKAARGQNFYGQREDIFILCTKTPLNYPKALKKPTKGVLIFPQVIKGGFIWGGSGEPVSSW